MAKSKIVLLEYTNPFNNQKTLEYTQRPKASAAQKTYVDYNKRTYVQTRWGRQNRYAQEVVKPRVIEPVSSNFELQLSNIVSARRQAAVQWKIITCSEQPELEGYVVGTDPEVLMHAIENNQLYNGRIIGEFKWHGKYGRLTLVPDDS